MDDENLSGAGVNESKINAAPGTIVNIEHAHLFGKLTNFIIDMNLKDIYAAKITLSQVVRIVEKSTNGKASKFR